jgi:hypothetical protein
MLAQRVAALASIALLLVAAPAQASKRSRAPRERWSAPEPVPMPGPVAAIALPPLVTADAARPEISHQRIWAYAAFTVGGASLVVGGVSGALVLSKVIRPSDPEAKAITITSALGLAAGAVGVVSGGLLWLSEPPAVTTYGGVQVRPKVLGLGSNGAVLGFKGVW